MAPSEPPHSSFRAFVETLRSDGDIIEIDRSIDPRLECGAIIRKVCETNDKAPLFTNLKNAKGGFFNILGAPGSLRPKPEERFGRLARHLGMPATSTLRQISEELLKDAEKEGIEPKKVATGPCKEHVVKKGEFDITQWPAPLLHQDDGGKYLQTYGVNIATTPDGSWTNWSVNRAQVHGKDSLVVYVAEPQHIWQVHEMWKKEGKDMPFAIAFGVPPPAVLASSMALPENMSEGAFIGAQLGSPLEVVKCETNDILVPATSEIVLEGVLSITQTAPEGPFGEMHNYLYPGETHERPVFHVHAVTHRDKAILPVSNCGRITDETHTIFGLIKGGEMRQIAHRKGLPVLDIAVCLETQTTWAAVSIDTARVRELGWNPEKLREEVGEAIYSEKPAAPFHRLILCGPDIDIYDFQDVMFAYSTRCRPGADETVFKGKRAFVKSPLRDDSSGKVVDDALLPAEYTHGQNWKRADFNESFPESVKEKVKSEWESMGFKKWSQ